MLLCSLWLFPLISAIICSDVLLCCEHQTFLDRIRGTKKRGVFAQVEARELKRKQPPSSATEASSRHPGAGTQGWGRRPGHFSPPGPLLSCWAVFPLQTLRNEPPGKKALRSICRWTPKTSGMWKSKPIHGKGQVTSEGKNKQARKKERKKSKHPLQCLPLVMAEIGKSLRATQEKSKGWWDPPGCPGGDDISRNNRAWSFPICILQVRKRKQEQVLSHTLVQSIMTAELMKECNHKYLPLKECRTLAQVINKVVRTFSKTASCLWSKTSHSSKIISRNLGGNMTHLRKPHKSLSHRYLKVLKAKII